MKTLLLLLGTLTFSAFAQEMGPRGVVDGINYGQLSDRFVTSVKEAQVEQQFLNVPEVRECLEQNKVTDAEVAQATEADVKKEIQKKQAAAAQCVKDKLAQVDANKLEQLSKNLELEAFGIVKGKGNQEIIDYFSKRLEKALYGVDSAGNPKRLKDQKLVDQKVFVDLYETQVGKNILLEISNYCLNSFNPTTSNQSDRFNAIEGLDPKDYQANGSSLSTLFSNFKDAAPVGTTTDQDKIYEKFMNQVVGQNGQISATATKTRLSAIFQNCAAFIPIMCEKYEACSCEANKRNPDNPTPQSTPCAQNRFSALAENSCTSFPASVEGQKACHVVARLRGYRTNLAALAKTKEQMDALRDTTSFLTHGGGTYNPASRSEQDSIDSLTSLTSADAADILKQDELTQRSDDLNAEECAANPENADCFKEFYSKDETVNFANASIGFSAATAVESARIKEAGKKKEDLEAYLKSRGYLDLVEKLKTMPEDQIVAMAVQRFETEREATFKEMSAAFEKRQLVGSDQEKETKATATKAEIKNKSKEFQNLLLFNNVVSSYLDLKKRDQSGELQDAGTNVRALKREFDAVGASGAEDAQSLAYFEEISGAESQVQAGDNPIIDTTFLDALLGNTAAQQQQQQNGGGRN